ncbi:hypothetical protein STEG23_027146 [Scotinomys teguina]
MEDTHSVSWRPCVIYFRIPNIVHAICHIVVANKCCYEKEERKTYEWTERKEKGKVNGRNTIGTVFCTDFKGNFLLSERDIAISAALSFCNLVCSMTVDRAFKCKRIFEGQMHYVEKLAKNAKR